jgi:peptidoglycan-N-acetylglucosamine deacetylase
MYLTKTPDILKPIASDLLWDVKTEEKEIFLTFDDGPIPEVTPLVLDILDRFNAKATFFCVGENIVRHPEVLVEVLRRGHLVGNHTYSHEKGWDTSHYAYLKTYLKCQALTKTQFFRPPHGQIKRQQVQTLKKHTTIVMWDVLSGDFDPNCDTTKCVHNVMKSARKGSIVVFHDSLKARDTMLTALPEILQNLTNLGYCFPVLRGG